MVNDDIIVRMTNVCVSFDDKGGVKRNALFNFNLIARKKEIVVLVGKSCSGKSTVINTISNKCAVDSGVLYIKDESMGNFMDGKRPGEYLRGKGLVVLDEPTLYMNPKESNDFVESMLDDNDANETCYIIATHDPVVIKIAHNVYEIIKPVNLFRNMLSLGNEILT